jgi:hypothetical protein
MLGLAEDAIVILVDKVGNGKEGWLTRNEVVHADASRSGKSKASSERAPCHDLTAYGVIVTPVLQRIRQCAALRMCLLRE